MMIPVTVQLNIPFKESDIRLRLKTPEKLKKHAHRARVFFHSGDGKNMVQTMRDLNDSLSRFEQRIKVAPKKQ